MANATTNTVKPPSSMRQPRRPSLYVSPAGLRMVLPNCLRHERKSEPAETDASSNPHDSEHCRDIDPVEAVRRRRQYKPPGVRDFGNDQHRSDNGKRPS